MLQFFSRGGPFGTCTGDVMTGVCAATNPKYWTTFFLKLGMMIDTFGYGIVEIIMRSVFPIIEKTYLALDSFRKVDFPNLNCPTDSYCSLRDTYTTKKLQCFQNALNSSQIGMSFGIQAGYFFMPPGNLGMTVELTGMSIDFLQCIFDSPDGVNQGLLTQLGGFGKFITVLINNIIQIELTDFYFLTCPILDDCSPGTVDGTTCLCVCPQSHAVIQGGCGLCPGVDQTTLIPCNGNGQCVAINNVPTCCCNSGWNGTVCNNPTH